jgi:hypothetical protein
MTRTDRATLCWAVTALGASLTWSAYALQDIPYSEMDHTDATIYASGWPATATGWSASASTFDSVVMVKDASGNNPTVMGWWQRGASSAQPTAWTWQGLLTPPGMPALASGHSSPGVIGDGRTVFAALSGTQDWRVIRRTESGWEYLGTATLPSISQQRAMSDSHIVFTSHDDVLRVYSRSSTTWTETWSAPLAALPVTYVHGLQIAGGQVFLSGSTSESLESTAPGKVLVFQITSEGSLQLVQELNPPATPAWRLGPYFATDGNWMAVEFHQLGADHAGIAFYRRDGAGFWSFHQLVDSEERPRFLTDGRLLASQGVWSLNDETWQRGARFGVISAFLINADCVYANSSSVSNNYISVWHDPFDCNSNGIQDAAEIAADPTIDCNANGRPDAVDIAEGQLLDTNLNGVPDTCEPDCDGNLVPDLWQMRNGAATTCTIPATLAPCAIAAGAPDANGDGVVDACGPDLDGDGVPDLIGLAGGAGTDCNHDGVPDSVATYHPLTPIIYEYVVWGSGTRAVVAASYPTDPEQRWLTGISFSVYSDWWDNIFTYETQPIFDPLGKPYMAFVASDPNGDGDPADAELLWAGVGLMSYSEEQYMAIPNLHIEAPGFFVGFTTPTDVFSYQSGANGYSGWRTAGSCLGTYAQAYAQCGRGLYVALPGDWPMSQPPDPQTLWRYDSMPDIRVHTDLCDSSADLNGDGTVSGADLGVLLSAWGPASNGVADFNHDGSVDGLDLGILLSQWGGA